MLPSFLLVLTHVFLSFFLSFFFFLLLFLPFSHSFFSYSSLSFFLSFSSSSNLQVSNSLKPNIFLSLYQWYSQIYKLYPSRSTPIFLPITFIFSVIPVFYPYHLILRTKSSNAKRWIQFYHFQRRKTTGFLFLTPVVISLDNTNGIYGIRDIDCQEYGWWCGWKVLDKFNLGNLLTRENNRWVVAINWYFRAPRLIDGIALKQNKSKQKQIKNETRKKKQQKKKEHTKYC